MLPLTHTHFDLADPREVLTVRAPLGMLLLWFEKEARGFVLVFN